MIYECEEKTQAAWSDCKKETKANDFRGALRASLLRALGMNRGRGESSGLPPKNVYMDIPMSAYPGYSQEVKIALLEVDRKKAEAFLEWQKRRFLV